MEEKMKNSMKWQDKIRGSLVGGAIGDALGYPVEFTNSYEAIQTRYGEQGITRFDLHPYWLKEDEWTGKAIFSDDTQMTLFTVCGLLNAKRKGIFHSLLEFSKHTLSGSSRRMNAD